MEKVNQEALNEISQGLGINELLQVQVQDDPNPTSYRSRIEDIVEGKLVAAWPTSNGIRLPAHPDQILSFSLVRDGNAYAFTGLVDSTVTEPLPLIIVIISSSILRVQRRQNYRIKCLLPVEITSIIQASSKEAAPIVLHIKTTTYDISASGISIRNAKMIPEGSILEVKIGLAGNEPPIKVLCRLMYCEASKENSKLFHSAMQFLAIGEKEKARIVRYVYRTQLKGMRD